MLFARNALWLLSSLFLLGPELVSAQDSTLVAFKLKDQFDREYSEESWGDSTIVLFGSDKGGLEFNKIWAKAVRDSLKATNKFEKIKLVGLSDLRIVPFFLKRLVYAKLPKHRKKGVLLDWQGVFPQAYHFVPDACNILVFNAAKKLVHQSAVQQFDPKEFNTILEKIALCQ